MKPAGKVRERNDDMAGYIEAPSRRVESGRCDLAPAFSAMF
jgi:hypothetical protein